MTAANIPPTRTVLAIPISIFRVAVPCAGIQEAARLLEYLKTWERRNDLNKLVLQLTVQTRDVTIPIRY